MVFKAVGLPLLDALVGDVARRSLARRPRRRIDPRVLSLERGKDGLSRFGRTMSIYSTECICMVCAEAERKRKDYARACEAERAAVAAGDRNFKGVGF